MTEWTQTTIGEILEQTKPTFSSEKDRRCNHCGARMVVYRFTFNKGLLTFLKRLAAANGPAKTDALHLTYSQRTNSQKLRYWGLARPHENEESRTKAGWWVITQKGRDFLAGKVKIPKYAWTYRGVVERLDGELLGPKDIDAEYEYHADYAAQATTLAELG